MKTSINVAVGESAPPIFDSPGALGHLFRMPTVFGPASGPRNVPARRQQHRYAHDRVSLTIEASTDAVALAALLPPRCSLAGEPVVSVSVECLTRLGWLAGRGYNLVMIKFPNVAYAGSEGRVIGDFVAVVWESLCDSIITGRDEIAFPKIYADIENHRIVGDSCISSASWLGFRFFDIRATDLVAATPTASEARASLAYKYIPMTGRWGEADVEYMTMTTSDPNQPVPTLRSLRIGTGTFSFRQARWEDMPTQYVIVNALSALPITRFISAQLKSTSVGDVDSTGGGNFSGQRIVR
jgi:hypothetical protein